MIENISKASNIEAFKKCILSEACNNRVDCQKIRDLAEKYDISLEEAGKLLNELGIKVSHCGLGCF